MEFEPLKKFMELDIPDRRDLVVHGYVLYAKTKNVLMRIVDLLGFDLNKYWPVYFTGDPPTPRKHIWLEPGDYIQPIAFGMHLHDRFVRIMEEYNKRQKPNERILLMWVDNSIVPMMDSPFFYWVEPENAKNINYFTQEIHNNLRLLFPFVLSFAFVSETKLKEAKTRREK